jgi:hypothetical protein
MDDLDAAVQERIDNDQDFQATLADLSDDEKAAKVAEKSGEVRKVLFKETADAKAKAEQIAEDQRKRAEKAEADLKKHKPKPKDGEADPSPTEERLSDADMYALRHADVHPDDVPEVVKAAKVLGKSVTEALNDEMVKSILAKRVEHRKTGNATDPGRPQGGAKRRSDAEVLADFKAGKIPEPGSPEAEQLFRARRGIKNK